MIEEDPESEGHSKTVTVTRCAVAQLSIVGVASLSHDCSVAEDVGCLLSQVHCLGAFKARELAVSASRKVAAVVSELLQSIYRFQYSLLAGLQFFWFFI